MIDPAFVATFTQCAQIFAAAVLVILLHRERGGI